MNGLTVIENGIVPVYTTDTGEKIVDGRELWEALESKRQFADWVKDRLSECDSAENVDFQAFSQINEKGGRPTTEYTIRLSIAKEMAMLERNEKGKQVRKYFIEVEEAHHDTKLALNNLSPQLQLLIGMELKQKEMERRQTETEKQLALTEQKAEAAQAAVTTIKETIVQRDDDWRKWQRETISRAVDNSPEKDYRAMYQWSYDELERRACCRLGGRLNNLKERLREQGVTKTKVEKASRLDVIEADVRLKEIYTTIVKELSIRYSA